MSGLLQLPWKTEISWQGNNLEPFFGFTKQFLFLEGPTLLRTIKWHEPTRSFKLIGLSLTPKAIQFLVTLCDRGPCDPMRSYVTQAEIRKNYVREVLNCVFTPFFHTPPKINRSNLKKNWFGRCCSFSRGPVFSGSILIFQKGVFSPLEFPSTSSPKKNFHTKTKPQQRAKPPRNHSSSHLVKESSKSSTNTGLPEKGRDAFLRKVEVVTSLKNERRKASFSRGISVDWRGGCCDFCGMGAEGPISSVSFCPRFMLNYWITWCLVGDQTRFQIVPNLIRIHKDTSYLIPICLVSWKW